MVKQQDPIKERIKRLTELTEVNPEKWPELSQENPEYKDALDYFSQFHTSQQTILFGQEIANSLRQNHLYIEKSREVYKKLNQRY